MGWLSWERFRCQMNCDEYPDDCISEKLFKSMADAMVRDGYLAAGYEYVIIDDCWLAKDRDAEGRLQPDPVRFPSGIKALADYIHGKGLKFGIYEDFGTHTCGGFPGSEYYLQNDAQTFANWTVDYFKMDGCYSDVHQYDDAYPVMGYWLNKTGRPILYSCSWPAYQESEGMKPDYKKIAKYCNVWRNYNDIDDSWSSVAGIVEFYGQDHTNFVEVAGPGNFNDPDMLIIGNFGLSPDQERTQMALWAMFAAPMIMSVDLRHIRPSSRALLQNRPAIAISQDRLGVQAKRLKKDGSIQIWTRPIQPDGSFAFVFHHEGTATPIRYTTTLQSLGLTSEKGYNVTEVFDSHSLGIFKATDKLVVNVNPTGVFFGKAIPL